MIKNSLNVKNKINLLIEVQKENALRRVKMMANSYQKKDKKILIVIVKEKIHIWEGIIKHVQISLT
jgi:hypothetical protein